MPVEHDKWIEMGWIRAVPDPHVFFACPNSITHSDIAAWCFLGQMDCLTCGLAIAYEGGFVADLPVAGVVTPAQEQLEDGASSYAGGGLAQPGARAPTPTQALYKYNRATARYQKTWGLDPEQRLRWSRAGRPREYRWANHYRECGAVGAASKPPSWVCVS